MNEQMSLFDDINKTQRQRFADRLCEEFNKLDTVYKGTFYADKCELSKWEHIADPDKVLMVTIKSPLNNETNRFIQFKGDERSQINICNAGYLSEYIKELSKDKDFSYSVTPWSIYIFYHKYEGKKIKL